MFNYCIDDVLDKFKKSKTKKDKKKKHEKESDVVMPDSHGAIEEIKEASKEVEAITERIEKGEEVSEKEIDETIAKSNNVAKSIIRDNKKSHQQQQNNNHGKNTKFRNEERPKNKKENKKEKKKELNHDEDDNYSIIIDFD